MFSFSDSVAKEYLMFSRHFFICFDSITLVLYFELLCNNEGRIINLNVMNPR